MRRAAERKSRRLTPRGGKVEARKVEKKEEAFLERPTEEVDGAKRLRSPEVPPNEQSSQALIQS